jgi:hypothetical protein
MGKKTFTIGIRKAVNSRSAISMTNAGCGRVDRSFPELSVRAAVPE